ncbi:MAG: amino acid permease [Gemmatimonadota bacterium]|nr:amino acid permease [Gemmatimonadota bacterium]
MSSPVPRRELSRSLSLRDAIALLVGTVIGTGVFFKAAPMSQLLGSPGLVLLAWIAAGILSLAGALTYAELGAMYPRAGGDYVFLREAYGGFPAFMFGWTNFAVITTTGLAAIATGFASFLSGLLPLGAIWASRDLHILGQTIHWTFGAQQVVAVAAILVFSAINSAKVSTGGATQSLLTLAKFVGIGAIVLGALFFSHTRSMANFNLVPGVLLPDSAAIIPGAALPPAMSSLTAFGAAMIAALWAFQGWSNMTMVSGEIEKPQRNVPRGLIYGMLIVLGVYLLVNFAYFYALPFGEVVSSNSTAYRTALPVAAKAAGSFLGSAGGKIISIAFLISVMGSLNGIIIMNSRVPFAMARDGIFFPRLGELNAQQVPARAIWIEGILGCVLALSGTFDQITTACVFAVWIFFALTAAAVFVLRRKRPGAERPYRVLGYPILPALFVVVALWLLMNTLRTNPVESAAGLFLIAIGVPIFVYFRKRANWITPAERDARLGR